MKNLNKTKSSPVNPDAIDALERALSAIVEFNNQEECLPSKLVAITLRIDPDLLACWKARKKALGISGPKMLAKLLS